MLGQRARPSALSTCSELGQRAKGELGQIAKMSQGAWCKVHGGELVEEGDDEVQGGRQQKEGEKKVRMFLKKSVRRKERILSESQSQTK